MSQVHIAITRRVKRGREAEFEAALRGFARESLHHPGTKGVLMIGPVTTDGPCEFGILRSFESEHASKTFYDSDMYRSWENRIADHVDGKPIVRPLSGLEAFFRDGVRPLPPRWKMAVVTWLGVFPCVLFWSTLVNQMVSNLPHVVLTAVSTALVVITLTWGVMPWLTRLLRGWLHKD